MHERPARRVSLIVLLSLSSCVFVAPADEVRVPVSVEGVEVRVQVWGNTSSEGRFELVVSTPEGRERRVLWKDWGPAQRVSLYLTPQRALVALGGGGGAEMISVKAGSAPRWVPYPQRPKENGEDWKYLGAVDRSVRRLVYYAPADQPECIPLYGAGSSPYRRDHQDEGTCASQEAGSARGPFR
jgi:hypothetical protein